MAVQTQIQTRRGTAASWTSTNPTLAAGEIGFESDTNKFKIGTGSTAWASLPYASNVSPLTTKGDLYGFSTTNARLPAGNNGETLVADSSTATGLRYQVPVNSNPVLNSAMQIWQRGTSSAVTSGSPSSYNGSDRWQTYSASTGKTVSRQATNDATNLPFIQYCLRMQRDSGNTLTGLAAITQNFETINAIPYAGKTVTLSFYARAGANYSSTSSFLNANLQTGTGTDQNVINGYTGGTALINSNVTLTTTWQRFSSTGTLATSATEMAIQFYYTPTGTAGAADFFEVTGVQMEVGSVATPFKTYAGTIQGELAACQRYYQRSTSGTPYGNVTPQGFAKSTTQTFVSYPMKVTLRAAATTVEYANIGFDDGYSGIQAVTNVGIAASNPDCVTLLFTGTGLTTSRPYQMIANNNSAGYLAIGAEL